MSDPGGAPRLSVREKSLYAAGDLADGITNVSLGTFLLFYLTAVCGLPGSLAGAAVAISLMVDAVVDPLIGYISDNTRSRWGRRHPYMFASAIPFAGALGMIYSIPAFESTWALFAYVVAVLIVLRVSFSTFVLPYAAVGAELRRQLQQRETAGWACEVAREDAAHGVARSLRPDRTEVAARALGARVGGRRDRGESLGRRGARAPEPDDREDEPHDEHHRQGRGGGHQHPARHPASPARTIRPSYAA